MGVTNQVMGMVRAFGLVSKPSDHRGNIEHQRSIVNRKEFMKLGHLVMIIFDPGAMRRPVVNKKLLPAFNCLDWQGTGPWLGLSKDHKHLILYGEDGGYFGAVPHPPDIWDVTGPERVAVEQRYRDRTTEKLRNSGFLLFEGVNEIVYKPWGIASWCKVRVMPDHSGRHMSFLIDPSTREGHLVGGCFLIGAVV